VISTAKIGKILLYCFAGLVVLVLLAMLAVKLALARAPQYQAEIKEWVHAQTGYHIGFAHVSPAFRWYGPELYFDHPELRSKDDQRVLARAGGARIAADIWQLLRSGKLLAGRIEIDAPNIVIERLGSSRFAVAGEIELGGDNSSPQALQLNDLPAGKLVIHRAVLTLQNWNAQLPQLILPNVELNLARDVSDLALEVSGRLPPVLGGTANFRGSAHGRGDWQSLSWKSQASAQDVSFPGWRRLLPEYLGNLDAGLGEFIITASGAGRTLSRADLDFTATGVATQLPDGPTAQFDQMSGALSLVHAGDRWSLGGKHVRVARGDPESAFDVSWRGSDAGLLELKARATYLRVETLLPLTGFLPQKDVRKRLRELALTGEWTDTVFALARNTLADPWQLQVQAKFKRAGFAPAAGAPGLRGLTGSIAGTESGGHVYLDTNTAVFHWPTQFALPVELEVLKANIYWKRSDEELLVATPVWEVKTHDGDIHAQLSWQQPADGSSPLLTLVGRIQNGNVASARNYLPRGLIEPSAFAWLNRALVAGRMQQATVLFKGPVRNFPFRDGSGLFLARCAIDGLTLDYAEGWPAVDSLNVTAEFRNAGMSGRMAGGARAGSMILESGDAHFPDFSNGELRINASAHGDAAAALAYLRATPLDEISEHAFSDAEAAGPLQLNLDLFLPLAAFEHRQVLVHGRLDGATVTRAGWTTKATDVTGDFDIDNGQVARADVRGQVLGGPFQMQARSARNRPATRTQLDFRGTASADAVRTALSIPPAMSISGQTDWRAVLKMVPEPARERSLRISSTLVGFEMKLPAPLYKAANTPLPSWFEIQWPAVGGPQGAVSLGTLVSAKYTLESDPEGVRLAHASLTFGTGESTAADTQIFNVGGVVERLDLAGWLALSTPDKNAKPLSYYMRTARLDVSELDYLGLAFRDVSLDLAVTEGSWRISVGGPNVIGTITIPSAAESTDPWNLQFDRLRFDVADSAPTDNAGESNAAAAPVAKGLADPRGVPPIKFHATEFIWGERRFGDVTASLTKVDDGIVLKQLTVVSPNMNVGAHGEWRGADQGISRIQGTLTSSDVESTMKDMGYADVIHAKTGKLEFDLNWPGAPTTEVLATAAGHVQLSLDKGQVTGLKPGAGRVLGLASIAALPRRLALDFSDLTDKGLAFDTIRGDFDLRDGNAYTENVLLKGPAGEIGLIGRIGLKNKDYDQTAVVTGNVGNSLSIPVASALVGGPVVGAAVLLFTQVFKQPLKGLARGYYRITGSWDNPTVERIKSADAAAAAAEAPK
jgi:uncharacterized protein (TIGR02099 family)